MPITAYTGPVVSFGITKSSTGGVQEYNEARAPSAFDLGVLLSDPRHEFSYKPGMPAGSPFYTWPIGPPMFDAIPSAKSSNGVVPGSSTQTGTTALTISASGGSTNIAQLTTFIPTTGTAARTVWVIDGVPTGLVFGSSNGNVNVWNPQNALARCITVGSTANETTVTYTIVGYDLYGYRMTQALAGANNA